MKGLQTSELVRLNELVELFPAARAAAKRAAAGRDRGGWGYRGIARMSSLPVNIVDLIVIVVLLLSALLALFRGIVKEVLSILGWVAALAATYSSSRLPAILPAPISNRGILPTSPPERRCSCPP